VKRPPANLHYTSLSPNLEISSPIVNQYQSGFAGMMKNQSGSPFTTPIFLTVFFTTDYSNYLYSVDLVDYTDAVSDRYFKKSFNYRKL